LFEVIKAESQAVVKTLTEYDFQDAFKKGQKRWERCKCAEQDFLTRWQHQSQKLRMALFRVLHQIMS
jgi:hypothetical protein